MYCYKCGSPLDLSGVCQECRRKKNGFGATLASEHDEPGEAPEREPVRAALARWSRALEGQGQKVAISLAVLSFAAAIGSLWLARDEIAALLPQPADSTAAGTQEKAATPEPTGHATTAAATRGLAANDGGASGESGGVEPVERGDSNPLALALKCLDAATCLAAMLDAADPLATDVIDAATARLAGLKQPERGDARTARLLKRSAAVAFAKGERDSALALLQRASEADPSDADIHVNLAHVALRSGRPELARESLERALAIDPRRSGAWVGLAESYAASGDGAHALDALLLAHAFSPKPQQTVEFFERQARDSDLEAMRPLLVQAAQKLRERSH